MGGYAVPTDARSIQTADPVDLDLLLSFTPITIKRVCVGHLMADRTLAFITDERGELIAPLPSEERWCCFGATSPDGPPPSPCRIFPGQCLADLFWDDDFIFYLLRRFVHQLPPQRQRWQLLVTQTQQHALTAPAGMQWVLQKCPDCDESIKRQDLAIPTDGTWRAFDLGNVAKRSAELLERAKAIRENHSIHEGTPSI